MDKLKDKRVKKVIVFDTETAPCYDSEGKQFQLVFDFGYTIASKQGDIFIKRNFLIREIFTDMEKMRHAFYFSKFPQYLEMLGNGTIKMVSWIDVIYQFESDILEYNIKEVYAYNIAYDKQALANTHKILTGRKFLFWEMLELKTNCLWGMSCESLLARKGFITIAIEQGWLSQSGNILTNAETCYRYLTCVYDFIESHTALDDAIIETEIMARCFKSHKKMSFGILCQPWRLVKAKAEVLGLLEVQEYKKPEPSNQ